MNRRSFFSAVAKAAAGFAILPAATTYARQWKRVSMGATIYQIPVSERLIVNPAWVSAQYIMELIWHPKAIMIGEKFCNDREPFPVRFDKSQSGEIIPIPRLIKVPVDSPLSLS